MHFSNKMIAKDLKNRGKLIRLLMPYFTEKKFRKINKIMKAGKGRNFSKTLDMKEIFIERTDGSQLRVVIFYKKDDLIPSEELRPGLLWIHGGGYAIGIPEQDFSFAELFIARHNCVIFMPDYTLSTQKPYPAAFDDCYQTLLYMKEHAAEFSINENQIMTGGDSAGGGLCVAVDLMARDSGDVKISFTMPLYPMLDSRKTSSSTDNDAPVWNSKSNEAGWKLYLGDENKLSKYAVPALENDFKGFPSTVTYIGTIEPFYDETMNFVKKLEKQSVEVSYKVFQGAFHAFDIVCAKSKSAKEAREFLGKAFENACKS